VDGCPLSDSVSGATPRLSVFLFHKWSSSVSGTLRLRSRVVED